MSLRAVLLVELVVTLVAASAFGCAHAAVDTNPVPTPGLVELPDADIDDAETPTDAQFDAMLPQFNFGSPLCNASTWMGCNPDDPASANAKECNLAPDGGVYSPAGGYGNAPLACHVEQVTSGPGVRPVCTPVGAAADGMPCGESTDCAPGYECVGDRTCRHYCCAGGCARQDEFCDIQPTASDPALKVPVCMLIRSCGLLDQPSDAGSCPRSQTCAVVHENGATSCVPTGQSQAGDECDTDHCARGLTCVGTSGHRRCYILCHTMARTSECPSTRQTCTGGLPLFPVPGIGICQ